MNCFFCKGTLEEQKTNYMVDLGHCIIIIKGVPSYVCRQCGEVSYSDKVAAQLQRITDQLKGVMTEIAVVNYSDKVA